MPTATARIVNKRGLHARAAAKMVKCAQGFSATIMVSRAQMPAQADLSGNDPEQADATSILDLMMLGAQQGVELTLDAQGGDAQAALSALKALIENRFDEDE